MMDDEWRRVWAQMTDEELEDRLFTYFWLAMNTPNSQSNRLRELVDEAERRGQAAMVERAKLRAANIRRYMVKKLVQYCTRWNMDGIRKPLPSVGSPIAGIHNLRPEQELHKHAEHPGDYDQFPSAPHSPTRT
jgi:hypothetical protein